MKNSGFILFAILLAVGGVGMATTGAAVYIRLVYLSSLLLAGSFLWTRVALFGVRIARHARSLRASVGDIFEETFELLNTSRIPRLFVEVTNESPIPQASGSRVLTLIGGRQNRTYLARTWLTRRGAFPLGPTVLSSGDPFGFFSIKRTFTPAGSLLVLPMIIPISEFASPPGLLPGGKVIRRKAFEVTPHASGVREYATGDSLKRIHWPSTARRGKLMVKEFEQDPQSEVWIFLDGQSGIHCEQAQEAPKVWQDWMFSRRPELSLPPSTLEYGVSIAASLAHYYIGKRRAVGFVTGGPVYTVIPAEHSERQESKVLETLTFVAAEGQLPLTSLVDLQSPQMPLGSSALLITPSVADDVLLAVELLQRRNLRPVVILLMAESFGGRRGSDELAQKLLQRNVPLCRIFNNANLAETLSGFAGQANLQETHLWQA
jgi:uncharacterized protein (DUF58 family)